METPNEGSPGRRLARLRPSPAMIVAVVALFVAMGGTTYAVKSLPRQSVGSAQLKRNAVHTRNIRHSAVTRSKISRRAVDSARVLDNSLAGRDIRENTLGTVPRASTADAADNAAKVNGQTVNNFAFAVSVPTALANVLSSNGLTVQASCATGPPALSVRVTTAQDDGIIHAHGTYTGGTAFYLADDSFDTGETFDPLPSGASGTGVSGQLVYELGGKVVTISYLAEETATGCVFAGTAIG